MLLNIRELGVLIKSDECQFNMDLIKLIVKTNSGLIY
jgi:hypothetical protein